MTITAKMVGQLRAQTDAPMMECKKALTEANGDFAVAKDILRAKLGNKALQSTRVTTEGVVLSLIKDQVGVIIELNCETDFVAKNADFIKFANTCAQIIASNNPANVHALSLLKTANDFTIEEKRLELITKIGENISIRRFERLATQKQLVSYMHDTKIAVLVEFTGNAQLAKDIAMHIAAMKPLALSAKQVSPELIEKERLLAVQQAKASGKPENIQEKMVTGSVQKFLKEVSLLDQIFVKNDKQTIAQLLDTADTQIDSFSYFVLGDGLIKQESDFAAEVAAQVASSNSHLT